MECLAYYNLVSLSDSPNKICFRRIRFSLFVCRDFVFALLVSQIVIFSLAFLIYSIDSHGDKEHSLLSYIGVTNPYITSFYYFMGLLLSLSFVGLVYSLRHCGFCRDDNCHNCYCADSCFFPYYISSDAAATGGTSDTALSCCCCHDCGSLGLCECGGLFQSCGDCSVCAGVSVGEEAFICLLVLVVLFAIVGVFVAIVLGSMYIQYIVQKHIHILHKWNLAQDYVVKDLDTDIPLESKQRLKDFPNIESNHSRKSSDEEVIENDDHNYLNSTASLGRGSNRNLTCICYL